MLAPPSSSSRQRGRMVSGCTVIIWLSDLGLRPPAKDASSICSHPRTEEVLWKTPRPPPSPFGERAGNKHSRFLDQEPARADLRRGMNDCLRLPEERAGNLASADRNEVAASSAAVYLICIDLAGRLGRFRFAFRDVAHVFLLLSPKFDDRRVMSCDAAMCITSKRTSP